jgi:ABC-type nickel/cobalt efflux system permease component RcnA
LSDFFNLILKKFIEVQQQLNAAISSNFREIGDGNSLIPILTILGIAFIYGVVHALGPGHGKLLVSSYFLRNNRSYKEAFKMGYLISIIHTISALSISFVLYYLLEVVFSQTFQEVSFYMTKISALLIIGVAIYLFFEQHKEHHLSASNQRSDLSIALSAGVIPCPGVMTIILFSILIGNVSVGIVAAVFMSVGMGLTISLSAIVATATRNQTPSRISKIFPFIGNSMILLLGIYLLIV